MSSIARAYRHHGAYQSANDARTPNPAMTSAAGLEAIFMAHRPALARYVRARLRGDGDSDDVLQDLWLKLSSLDVAPISEPLAYLYRMAENLVLDRRRSTMRRSAREMDWTVCHIDVAIDTAIDGQPSAERVLIARDHLRRVDVELARLPERTAFAFRAVRINGTPQKKVAAEMGISLSAVEKHLQKGYRAVLDLQQSIDAENDMPQRLHNEG